jgi:prolyl-tRNA synthetase
VLGWADLVSPLAISKENADKVQVLLDEKLVAHSGLLAFHPSDAKSTIFVPYEKLHSYLGSTGVKITNVEFAAAATGYDSPVSKMGVDGSAAIGKADAKRATTKPAKEDAKIEGAALIGIDVRKELDFPTWYTQVLTKGDMVPSSPRTELIPARLL